MYARKVRKDVTTATHNPRNHCTVGEGRANHVLYKKKICEYPQGNEERQGCLRKKHTSTEEIDAHVQRAGGRHFCNTQPPTDHYTPPSPYVRTYK